MTFLLDTNVCIAFLNGSDDRVRERLLALSPDQVRLCSVVKAELLYGARNSTHVDANLRKLEKFFAVFACLPFNDEAAEWYGMVRAQLKRSGALIGPNDMMIAATGLASNAVLVTRNQSEYRRVPGLRVEVW